ncbi:protein of unknown function DUF214 [Spirochaeta thermophila DSM 6578]|uniref:Uncharacterized protein n=1 Tax=Winmispira thermophila (strain ATCC 700085 / DSM 6578 / Z-1203) TaxID=869211 RepID=G0GDV7_WINT7|nr:ABC transporter permease [Spirochaeta thermophila]AEJ62237.1 protein of unknown function DUF214 [Spirochaeta thermophila DSM 6578]
MDLREALAQAGDVIRENKVRSFFTMLAINIGVAALIAISIVGLAFRSSIGEVVGKYGTTLVWAQVNWRAYVAGESRRFLDERDVFYFRSLPGFRRGEPLIVGTTMEVAFRGRREVTGVVGVSEHHFDLFSIGMADGRGFTHEEVEGGQRVCVIGPELALRLFEDEPAVGQRIQVGGSLYTVVGVTVERNPQTEFLSDGSGNLSVFVPHTLLEGMVWPGIPGRYWVYLLDFDTPEAAERAARLVDEHLRNRYGLLRGEPRFRVERLSTYVVMVDRILSIVSLIVTVIAAVSLLVGGLGIMNIMLVAVTERTREIGVRMAVGAKRRDILLQFLVEAVVLCLLGGGTGLFLGVLIALAVCAALSWQFMLSAGVVVLTIMGALVLGMVFGIYPAYLASRLMPVEALRYEV